MTNDSVPPGRGARRARVESNTASHISNGGVGFEIEHSPDDAPDVLGNTADHISTGGTGFRTRVVRPPDVSAPEPSLWKAALASVVKTAIGKAVVGALISVWTWAKAIW